MNIIENKLCDIQGRLFELSLKEGYDSETFIKCFMKSKIAFYLDSSYNRYQWMGEEYLLEEIIDECKENLTKTGKVIFKEEIYWIGYIYRFWHYYKNESSNNIYKIASFKTMKINYLMFHTLSPEVAIDDLIEIYNQKICKNKRDVD